MKLYCPKCDKVFSVDKTSGSAPCPECAAEIKCPEKFPGPGAVIGDFLIEKSISQGGMGEVFVARQISLDRPVALKVLQGEHTKDKEYVDGLFREARAAAKINHPNIVQAYAVGEDEGVFFFAMELVRGDTLKAILKREGVLAFDKAARIICDVAKALDTAWREQKLVHQDIKPDNIMWDNSSKQAKLADLGIAKTAAMDGGDDDSDEVFGTPQYISPEQLTGIPTDVRSDIYSLGATFFHFVTGRFPYVAPTAEELAHMHNAGNLEPPQKFNPLVPDEINRIIVKMMARQLDNRYQNPKELISDLEAFLANYEVEVRKNGKTGSGKVPKFKVPSRKSVPQAVDEMNTSQEKSATANESDTAAKKIVIPAKVWTISGIAAGGIIVITALAAGALYVLGKTGNIGVLPHSLQLTAERLYGEFSEKQPEKPVAAAKGEEVKIPEKAIPEAVAAEPVIRKAYQEAVDKLGGNDPDLKTFDAVWEILSDPQNAEERALYLEKISKFTSADEVRCAESRTLLRERFLQARENERQNKIKARIERERIKRENELQLQAIEKNSRAEKAGAQEAFNKKKQQLAVRANECITKMIAAASDPEREKEFEDAVSQTKEYLDIFFISSSDETYIKNKMVNLLGQMPDELKKLRKELAKIASVKSSHYIWFRDAKRKKWEVVSIRPGYMICSNSGNNKKKTAASLDEKSRRSLLRDLARRIELKNPDFYWDIYHQNTPKAENAPDGFWKDFLSLI